MNKATILLIEDDGQIVDQIQEYLEKRNYKVETVPTYQEALYRLNNYYDLALVDINLLDGSGESLIPKMKEKGIRVIVTTVKNDENFIVNTLDQGADDFLTKPFSLEILRARIDANIRNICVVEDSKIIYQDFILEPTQARISYQNQMVQLTSLEYELLSLFIQNPNRVFTRSQLLERFWENKNKFINDNTLTATIKRIRNKTNYHSILTVRGIGYRMG